jgi:hypothetical protein
VVKFGTPFVSSTKTQKMHSQPTQPSSVRAWRRARLLGLPAPADSIAAEGVPSSELNAGSSVLPLELLLPPTYWHLVLQIMKNLMLLY